MSSDPEARVRRGGVVGAVVGALMFATPFIGFTAIGRPSPEAYPPGGFEQSVLFNVQFFIVGVVVSGFIGSAVGKAIAEARR